MAVPSPGGNGPDDLVFTTKTGAPIRQHMFYRRYFKPAVRAALPAEKHGFRFHDLRHTCASLLIAAGAHPKAIQERLGHSSIQITMDRYGHSSPAWTTRSPPASMPRIRGPEAERPEGALQVSHEVPSILVPAVALDKVTESPLIDPAIS